MPPYLMPKAKSMVVFSFVFSTFSALGHDMMYAMLYTLYGTDIEKVRSRSRDLMAALQEKRPDASLFRLHLENWNNGKFTELLGSVGLFSNKYIVVLDNILTGSAEKKGGSNTDASSNDATTDLADNSGADNGSASDIVLDHLADLKKSDHVWIIIEDSLFGASSGKELGVKANKDLVAIKSALEKNSDKLEVHDVKFTSANNGNGGSRSKFGGAGSGAYSSYAKKAEITSFTFTDSFFNKDKTAALNALSKLKAMETAAEEIHGALWWQTKVVFQVFKKSAKDVSPFAAQKSARFLQKWTEKELLALSDKVVEIYHEAHLGKDDLGNLLSKLVFEFR